MHVPVDGGRMRTGSFDHVDDDQQVAVHGQHVAAMDRGTVAVVRTTEIVEVFVRAPAFDAAVCHVRPVERSARQRLRSTVEHQRVVQGG